MASIRTSASPPLRPVVNRLTAAILIALYGWVPGAEVVES